MLLPLPHPRNRNLIFYFSMAPQACKIILFFWRAKKLGKHVQNTGQSASAAARGDSRPKRLAMFETKSDAAGMGPALRACLLVYFVTHVPATLCIDCQVGA